MTTVLHYIQQWLPITEQFVHAHVTRSRHRAVVVSRLPFDNLDAFPHRPRHALAPVLRRTPDRLDHLVTSALVAGAALAHRAAVVHVHFGYRLNDVAGAAGRLHRPLVVSLHGHDATAYPTAHPGHYRGNLERADRVIVPSEFLAARAVALGARDDAIAIVPAGVDTAWFSPSPLPDGPPTAVFVGRLTEKKGIDVLLAAWPRIAAAVPGGQLRVLGDGPLAAAVRSTGAGVSLVAPEPDRRAAQVRDVLRSARVVVSPSRTPADGDAESLLLVNLEAQASGRPVVTTRHGGIPEFVADGETAILVREDDAAALADAVVTLLSDGDAAARMGAAGPAVAARFDITTSVARVDAVYDELVEGLRR